jgi:hypothetical protein
MRHSVRDEGVAGSNPATPTTLFDALIARAARYAVRNPLTHASGGPDEPRQEQPRTIELTVAACPCDRGRRVTIDGRRHGLSTTTAWRDRSPVADSIG